MPCAEVRGHALHYETAGDPRRGAIVLLQGLGADSTSWSVQLARLAEQFFVVVPDLAAHDEPLQAQNAAYAVTEQAETVAALLGLLDLPRVHLAGHGLGGIVALAFALGHPDRLNGLILEGTSPEALPDDVRARTRHALELSAVRRSAGSGAQMAVASAAQSAAGDTFDAAAWALVGFDGFVDRLETIMAPTLVIVGESDGPFMQRGAELLHGWIPFSRLVRVPDAGLVPHIENPATFASEALGFLREVETAL